MATLTCRIPKEAWMHGLADTNGSAPRAGVKHAGPWEPCVQQLVQFQHLGDDWDGCGAKSPSRELLTSAIALAYVFRDNGVPPPSRVVPGLDGIVLFEWQFPDGAINANRQARR